VKVTLTQKQPIFNRHDLVYSERIRISTV